MENAVQAAIERYGGVDVLCANAGIAPSSNLKDMSSEEWDRVLQTNLTGCFNVIKACEAQQNLCSIGVYKCVANVIFRDRTDKLTHLYFF